MIYIHKNYTNQLIDDAYNYFYIQEELVTRTHPIIDVNIPRLKAVIDELYVLKGQENGSFDTTIHRIETEYEALTKLNNENIKVKKYFNYPAFFCIFVF